MQAICVFLLIVAHLPNAGLAQPTSAPARAVQWNRLQLTAEFWAEGACAGDVNRDGHMDVLCGPFWYQGPDFKVRHEIYPATAEFKRRKSDGTEQTVRGFRGFLSGENGYSDNFLSFAADINGDDWIDYIVVGHPGNETFWYENPKGKAGHWTRRLALEPTDNESPSFVDVTGDGKPELVCMSKGTLSRATATVCSGTNNCAPPKRGGNTSLWGELPLKARRASSFPSRMRWIWRTSTATA